MEKNHVISDSLFNEAQAEFEVGRNWIAYNTKTYFLDNADMWFFRDKDEAVEFANDNISDREAYAVIHATSIISLLRQLPYGEDFHFNLSQKELENLFQSFDWNEAFYDPLHETIETMTEQDKDTLAKMETLLAEWENLYNRDPEAALELAYTYWEGRPMEEYKDNFLKIKFETMNTKNYDYLKDNIKYMGFGDKQNETLGQLMKEGKEAFQLIFSTEINKKTFEAVLQFRKSDNSDMYFFNSYKATMERSNGEKVEQTFYLNKGKGVTAKEAFNLLDGRAVFKELTNKANEPYKAWIQLDFEVKDKHNNFEVKQFHENYGYDLKTAVAKFTVPELDGAEKEKSLLNSLQKGNVQAATIVANGERQKVFLEANPQYKTVTIYDGNMHRLSQEQRQELQKGQSQEHGKEQSQQKEQKQDVKKTQQQGASDDLDLPKKKKSKGQRL